MDNEHTWSSNSWLISTFLLKPQLSNFGDINVLYTVYILPSVYVQRYTHGVHTHALSRFKRTYKLVTFIVMTGLCSLPDWRESERERERLFKRKCIDWKIQTQHATARLYTHSSGRTLNLESS